MYQQILVPTDGSAAANSAINHAVDIAATREATVHALYVIPTDELRFRPKSDEIKRLEAGDFEDHPDAHTRGKNATHDVVAAATEANVEATETIVAGTPHTEIVEYARRNDIDLIVMGTHGHSGVGRLLLGSTTERVIRKTSVPVLTVDVTRSVQ